MSKFPISLNFHHPQRITNKVIYKQKQVSSVVENAVPAFNQERLERVILLRHSVCTGSNAPLTSAAWFALSLQSGPDVITLLLPVSSSSMLTRRYLYPASALARDVISHSSKARRVDGCCCMPRVFSQHRLCHDATERTKKNAGRVGTCVRRRFIQDSFQWSDAVHGRKTEAL